MTVADAISGKEKLPGALWLLFSPEPQQVFRQTLGTLLDDPSVLGSCHLCRVRFKPGHKLTALYDISLQGHTNRPVAAVWRGHRNPGWRRVQTQIERIQADATGRGLLAPFRALAAESRGWNLRVHVAPLDTDFPQLVHAFDPRCLAAKLREVSERYGQAPLESADLVCKVEFVRYQPGLRHVLRFEQADGQRRAVVFAKVLPPSDSARACRVSTQLNDWLASGRVPLSCVYPLAFDAADSLVLYPEVVGFPLSEHLRRPNQELMTRLRSAGEAFNILHCSPQAITGGLELRDFGVETEEIAQASHFVEALLPEEGAIICAILENARELSPRLPQEPPKFIHCDLKLEHFFVTESGMTLIDFDTCRLGDPALDVGTFLADLRFWYSIFGLPSLEEAQNYFLEGYSPGAPNERLVRARLYEAIELVKIAVRRLSLFDERWTRQMESLVRDARRVMDRLQAKLGIREKNPSGSAAVRFSTSISDSAAIGGPGSKTCGKGARHP
jgi:phosphotransferase family enzyme